VDYFQLINLREIGYKESFKSFFQGFENVIPQCVDKNLKRKAFNKAWSVFSNIDFWSEKALKDFYTILEKYNEYGNYRNKAITEVRKFYEELLSVDPNAIHPIQIDYLNELSDIIRKYATTPTLIRVRPYFTNRNLILKIRLLNKKYKTLPFIREFNDLCLEVSSHYIDMELLIRNTKEQYKEYYYSFREFSRLINKVIKIID
jgi:hypothetical protein